MFSKKDKSVKIYSKPLTGLIKKSGNHYVALCLELNVCSQGETLEEAKRMLQDACNEYLSYMKEKGLESQIKPVPTEVLHEFLVEDVDLIKISSEWSYSENISFKILAGV